MNEDGFFQFNLLPGSPILRTLTLEQQIDWFEESLQKWVFKPAKLLLETGSEDVDFAVLGILNAIPEMLAQCQGYEKTFSEETFSGKKPRIKEYLYRKGIEYIFPERDHNVFDDKELIVKLLYGKLRSGLAHFALADENIFLERDCENLGSELLDWVEIDHMPGWSYYPPPPLASINVPKWYDQTEKRVGKYINDLRDKTNDGCRRNFSERITRGDAPRKGAATNCVCGKKRFCGRCVAEKFPASHLDGVCN